MISISVYLILSLACSSPLESRRVKGAAGAKQGLKVARGSKIIYTRVTEGSRASCRILIKHASAEKSGADAVITIAIAGQLWCQKGLRMTIAFLALHHLRQFVRAYATFMNPVSTHR